MKLHLPHIGHKKTTQYVNGGVILTETRPIFCPACKREKAIALKERMETEKYHIQYAQELTCDKCNKHIGYVYESDMEGSYFYCDNCKKNI